MNKQVTREPATMPITAITPKENIAGLEALRKEYESGRMVEKKAIALRRKLVELFTGGINTPQELSLMETILKRERVKGSITPHDDYLYNKLESERCDEKCTVKTKSPPQVHHMVHGMECKFARDVEKNRFIVFIPRVIPTEHQMSRELLLKIERGHPTNESEYPPPRTLIHRIVVSAKEFDAWFEVIEDDILTRPIAKREETYTF